MKEKIIEILEKYLGDVPHISADMIAGEIEDLYLLYPTEEQKGKGIIEEAREWSINQPTVTLSPEDARLFALMMSKPDPLNENHD